MNVHSLVTHTMLALAISSICAGAYAQAPHSAQTLTASPGTAPSNTSKPETLATITVTTGTRALNVQATQSLSPISVISPKQLIATGAPNLVTALRTLLPSLNETVPLTVDQASASHPAQLRGLSPDETLVLINGKREHPSSVLKNELISFQTGTTGTDLSAIPINAIQRVEVLRDGAAAQYGSDAIAGVINIILKKGAKGGSASVQYGQHAHHYHGLVGARAQGGANMGVALGHNQQGWLRLAINYIHQTPTNHAGKDGRFPGDPAFGTVTYRDGLPRYRDMQGVINFQFDLSPHVQLYGFSVLNKRSVDSWNWPRDVSEYANNGSGAIKAFPHGFRPTENTKLSDDEEVLGVRGEVFGWHYDISGNVGGNRYHFNLLNTYNYSLGPGSSTFFHIGATSNRQEIVAANFERTFDVGLSGPLSFAWGLAYRERKYSQSAGEPDSYFGLGPQGFSGYTPQDAGKVARQNKAIYVDLFAPLTNKLTGEIAVRHEKYSDFGSTLPWKLALRYQLTNTLGFRVTAATGFRAPSLAQEFFSSTAFEVGPINPVTGKSREIETRFFRSTDPAAEALGAQPLRAEHSRNYDLGVVYAPQQGINATFDVYQITVDDRIAQSQFFAGPSVQAFLAKAGFPFVRSAAFFTNAINTRTRGGDLVVGYPLHLGSHGTVKLNLGVNYNLTDITTVRPNPPQLGLAGVTIPVIGKINRILITRSTPKWKATLRADWAINSNWNVQATVLRFGKWLSFDDITAVPQKESAKTLLDLSATYRYRRWDFTLGGNNVANTYPDRNIAVNSVSGNIPYPLNSPFGFEGAFWYGRISYHW